MRFALAAVGVAAAVAAVATSVYGRGSARGVPRGFSPVAVASFGTRDYWVAGDYRCGLGPCVTVVRSTDAGAHFTRVGALQMTTGGAVSTLVFADARDGYAYTWANSPLYVTHDGGESWHRQAVGSVLGVSVGSRAVYALTGRCSDHGCRNFRLLRSSVTRTAWSSLAFPLRSGLPLSLAARGSDVWLLGKPRHRPDFDTIARSVDHGRTFTTEKGPCLSELGGTLVPAPDGVLWAVCPTGMMAELVLSTNGGRSFPAVRSIHDPGAIRLPALTNGAQIFPVSARVALLYRGASGPLLRTADMGRRWARVPRTDRFEQLYSLSFGTSRVGAALFTTRTHRIRPSFWRTTDGGATWHSMPIR